MLIETLKISTGSTKEAVPFGENINSVKQIVKKCKRFSSSLEHSHYKLVWETVKVLIPELSKSMEKLLEDHS